LKLVDDLFALITHLVVFLHLQFDLLNDKIYLRVYLAHHGIKPGPRTAILSLLGSEFLNLTIKICLLELLETFPEGPNTFSH